MAIIVRGVNFTNNILVHDSEDKTLDDGAIVSLCIDGNYSDLTMEGVNRLKNALDMIIKNNSS